MAPCRLGKVWEESQSVHPLIGVYLSTWPSQTTFEWGILTEPRGNKWCDMNKYACMKMGCQVCNYMTEVATGCSPEPGETEANRIFKVLLAQMTTGRDFSNGRNRMSGNKGEMEDSQTDQSQGNRSQWAPHRQGAPQEMLRVSLKAMGI